METKMVPKAYKLQCRLSGAWETIGTSSTITEARKWVAEAKRQFRVDCRFLPQ